MRLPVAVVIVSFNTRALLQSCLESLHICKQPLKIFVVDNASRDCSAEMVATHYPTVHLIRLAENIGFAAANNVALQHILRAEGADQHYVLLLNPDTVVHQSAIEQMVGFLNQHPRVAVVGPRLLNPDGSLQRAVFRFPTLAMTALDLFPPGEALPGRLYDSWWHGRYPQEGTTEMPFPVDHPLGACMLVRTAALAQAGIFDEQFFIYSEEVDLCYRIKRSGWAIWHLPTAQVTHVGGASTSQFRRTMFVELHRSRARFVAKHYSSTSVYVHRLVTQLGLLRLLLVAWQAYLRQQIDITELRSRLWAYAQLTQL